MALNSSDLIRAFFTHNGRQYRVVQFRGGKLEVYLCEQGTGLELWQGYCHEVGLDLGNAAYNALQAAPGQRYLFDAGSASRLLRDNGTWAH